MKSEKIDEKARLHKAKPQPHPGEVLFSEFMKPLGMSANQLCLSLRVPAQRVSEILNKQRRVTVKTALRLARLFNTTPNYWLDLQANYELSMSNSNWEEICQQVRPIPPQKSRGILKGEAWTPEKIGKEEGGRETGKNIGKSARKKPGSYEKSQAKLDLTGKEKKIYDLLSKADSRVHFDKLIEMSNLRAGELGSILVMLELKALVKSHFGDYYSIAH